MKVGKALISSLESCYAQNSKLLYQGDDCRQLPACHTSSTNFFSKQKAAFFGVSPHRACSANTGGTAFRAGAPAQAPGDVLFLL